MTTDISVASPPDKLAPEIMRYCVKQTNDQMLVVHMIPLIILALKTATVPIRTHLSSTARPLLYPSKLKYIFNGTS